MSIIMINSPSYSGGADLARLAEARLGYECIIEAQDMVELTAGSFQVPAEKIKNAVKRAPSLFGMSKEERSIYITYYQSTLINRLLRDNVIYSGSVGHLLVQGVSHIMKLYIICNMQERVNRMMVRENISEKEARSFIIKEDKEHKKWVKTMFNLDDSDPSLYDVVLNIGQLTLQDASTIIADAINNKRFHPMTYSVSFMKNLALSYRIKAALIHLDAGITVRVEEGKVIVHTKAMQKQKEKRIADMKEICKDIVEVSTVEINVSEDYFEQISTTL